MGLDSITAHPSDDWTEMYVYLLLPPQAQVWPESDCLGSDCRHNLSRSDRSSHPASP